MGRHASGLTMVLINKKVRQCESPRELLKHLEGCIATKGERRWCHGKKVILRFKGLLAITAGVKVSSVGMCGTETICDVTSEGNVV